MFSCCGCKDDEAWECAECFCSCHTYAHMDRQVNVYTPRDVAQILCDNSPRCDDGDCTHTSSEQS